MLPNFPPQDSCTVAVIGLGYVGLPLAVEFSKAKLCHRTSAHMYRRVIGFDINTERLDELRQGIDRTNEISASEFNSAQSLELTSDASILVEADVFVVTVPTPIDSAKRPDLSLLQKPVLQLLTPLSLVVIILPPYLLSFMRVQFIQALQKKSVFRF